MKRLSLLAILVSLIVSCSTSVPENARQLRQLPDIFPDYTNVTVPSNIAPLRFMLKEFTGNAVCTLTCGDEEIIQSADDGKFLFDEDDWKGLLEKSVEKSIVVKVYAEQPEGWVVYKNFTIDVAKEQIDSHLAYRLIPPGYEPWLELGIYQRDLTSYEEKPIGLNRLSDGNCMNCHSFCMQDPNTMMLHMRQTYGGTYVWKNGKLEKVNGAVNDSVPNLVYPSWHPSGRFIAFSTNDIHQIFHMQDKNRVEVFDQSSDVVVYDLEKHEALSCPLIFSKAKFETFPTFSPDGKTLYYCAADSVTMPDEYRKAKYSLCSISFEPETRTFGSKVDTLYNAHKENKSARFPRVSPDGKYLAFTLSAYGNFSIWHRDADLYMVNLQTRAVSSMTAANSNDVESYHSWSHDSHWLVFSSRRVDGLYTRPFFTYIDNKGKAHKPFMLPQADPEFYDGFMYSYNIPELITGEVTLRPKELARFAKSQEENK